MQQPSIHIRPATAQDNATIKRMVRRECLDMTSLKWQNFLIAQIDERIVGIGQLKPHSDCQELGSLVTEPDYRGQGVAAALIDALESRADYPLYLLCAGRMEPYYQRFDYQTISWRDAPKSLRFKTAPALPFRLVGLRVCIMQKDR